MKLETLYIRFFRSFNYDYLRKGHVGSNPDPWDTFNGQFYPYVKVRMEEGITTIVGANESGKSQLLAAVKRLLNGRDIHAKDFCRYSKFFAVDKAMAKPEFGGRFTHLKSQEKDTVADLIGLDAKEKIEEFYLFRTNEGAFIYLSRDMNAQAYKLDNAKLKKLNLPTYFEIDADIPLPNSVPIDYLAEGKGKSIVGSRAKMLLGQEVLRSSISEMISSDAQKHQALGSKISSAYSSVQADEDEANRQKRLELAETLLIHVAGIDRSAFAQMKDAVKTSEGYANGLVERINRQLSERLNFPKWWSQDKNFGLYLTLRDFDLVFTVRDRTGSDYSFSERSDGMKYFLSYFVQFLSYQPKSDSEILLMDEPDRFLSTSGQQDLLRLFAQYANPDDQKRQGVQVLYVTHSPFLIDKNHSDRIRVLEKGDGDEGTRVVRNVGHNHYEPLRSAFGAFVAETTFISNCNLMVEGQADQVLLAGVSTFIRERHPKLEALDLNTLTLVPAGSAEHIPYLVYLARGRDVEKPAIVVLLDGDSAGQSIRKELKKGYRGRSIIDDEFILSTNDLIESVKISTTSVQEIEDLIPARLADRAIEVVAKEAFTDKEYAESIKKYLPVNVQEGEKLFQAATRSAASLQAANGQTLRLDKVAFARGVIEAMKASSEGTPDGVDNFSQLFSLINQRQRAAMRKNARERTSQLLKRMIHAFSSDHPTRVTRYETLNFLESVEDNLPEINDETEAIRDVIRRIRGDHQLHIEPHSPVTDFASLMDTVRSMAHAGTLQAQRSPNRVGERGAS
ncbi:AAA family ATPase [Deinococcus sp. RIT780]|uniref:AAA family ATPase n=1 Tax=Deinococcus sp. RIT780 TaxID=2870472 RepID=UPI001C8A3959|nr:AAA family ATPase [Deinococcus sp. RIT780]MBX8463693.1 AAA family ATPase [Deinococcus sp. RIT780]